MVRWWGHLIVLFRFTNKDSVVLSSMNGGLLRKGPRLGRAQKDLKNTKNWYTIDVLGAIFAIFTILDTFTILLQFYYNTITILLQYFYNTFTILLQYFYSTFTILLQY